MAEGRWKVKHETIIGDDLQGRSAAIIEGYLNSKWSLLAMFETHEGCSLVMIFGIKE